MGTRRAPRAGRGVAEAVGLVLFLLVVGLEYAVAVGMACWVVWILCWGACGR